jgi:hypothetical protein
MILKMSQSVDRVIPVDSSCALEFKGLGNFLAARTANARWIRGNCMTNSRLSLISPQEAALDSGAARSRLPNRSNP